MYENQMIDIKKKKIRKYVWNTNERDIDIDIDIDMDSSLEIEMRAVSWQIAESIRWNKTEKGLS